MLGSTIVACVFASAWLWSRDDAPRPGPPPAALGPDLWGHPGSDRPPSKARRVQPYRARHSWRMA